MFICSLLLCQFFIADSQVTKRHSVMYGINERFQPFILSFLLHGYPQRINACLVAKYHPQENRHDEKVGLSF